MCIGDNQSKQSKQSNRLPVILGVAAGVTIAVAFSFLLGYRRFNSVRAKKSSLLDTSTPGSDSLLENSTSFESFTSNNGKIPNLRQGQIEICKLQDGTDWVLGTGTFGKVWRTSPCYCPIMKSAGLRMFWVLMISLPLTFCVPSSHINVKLSCGCPTLAKCGTHCLSVKMDEILKY